MSAEYLRQVARSPMPVMNHFGRKQDGAVGVVRVQVALEVAFLAALQVSAPITLAPIPLAAIPLAASPLDEDAVLVAVNHGTRTEQDVVERHLNILLACSLLDALPGVAAQRFHSER